MHIYVEERVILVACFGGIKPTQNAYIVISCRQPMLGQPWPYAWPWPFRFAVLCSVFCGACLGAGSLSP